MSSKNKPPERWPASERFSHVVLTRINLLKRCSDVLIFPASLHKIVPKTFEILVWPVGFDWYQLSASNSTTFRRSGRRIV